MAFSDIGSWSLICHTNHPASGGNSGGDWYSPEGERIGLYSQTPTVQGLATLRGPMNVQLYRTNLALPPEGIYHCEIQDNLNKTHQIYVGIYGSQSKGSESQKCSKKYIAFTCKHIIFQDLPK